MQTSNPETTIIFEAQLEQTIHRLVSETRPADLTERRDVSRLPFTRPVRIVLNEGGSTVSAFSREISPKGIGLMLDFELPRGEVLVKIPSYAGDSISILTEILWCQRLADGWYVSGGRFIEQLPAE